MNIFERVKNLWELSEFEPAHPSDGKKYPEYPAGTEVSMIVKKPEKQAGRFIPRVTVTPAEEITQQPIHEN